MQIIGRWRMLVLVRFLCKVFAADEDSESLITDSRTLMAGYMQYSQKNVTLADINYGTIKQNTSN